MSEVNEIPLNNDAIGSGTGEYQTKTKITLINFLKKFHKLTYFCPLNC